MGDILLSGIRGRRSNLLDAVVSCALINDITSSWILDMLDILHTQQVNHAQELQYVCLPIVRARSGQLRQTRFLSACSVYDIEYIVHT